jgi:hypothetical protein
LHFCSVIKKYVNLKMMLRIKENKARTSEIKKKEEEKTG